MILIRLRSSPILRSMGRGNGRFLQNSMALAALVACGVTLPGRGAGAAENASRPQAAAPPGKVDFVKQIKPVFEAHCVKCHGSENPSAGYEIYTKEKAFKAGDSDMPPITASNSTESQVYQLITSKSKKDRMPQKADPLDAGTIGLIKKWIDEGADWPDKVTLDETKAKQQRKDDDKKPKK